MHSFNFCFCVLQFNILQQDCKYFKVSFHIYYQTQMLYLIRILYFIIVLLSS